MFYGEPEGTGFEILDQRFADCLIGHARVERLWTGARWLEGPAWFPAGRYLVCSDIPNNRIMRWSEDDGHVSVYRQPSNNSNGNTRDREGRLITCEHDTQRVTRTEHDGTITVLADRFEGKRFDCGDKAGFFEANLAFALARPDMREKYLAMGQGIPVWSTPEEYLAQVKREILTYQEAARFVGFNPE